MKFRLFLALTLTALVGCGAEFPDEPVTDVQTALALRSALEQGAGGEAAGPAALAEPTGFGTLRGAFKVNGSPPQGQPLSQAVTHNDAAVCAPGGKVPLSQEVEVGPGGGLAGVAIYLTTALPADDPKWLHESYAALRTTEAVLDQKNCIFYPHVAAVWIEQPIKLMNSDTVAHNTKIDARNAAAANPVLPPGQSTLYAPGREERAPAPVSCAIHPWMKAYLLPRSNPYFAVTNENGEFEIANLPAGVELEFRVWQPKLQFLTADADVSGQTQKISKGRLTLTLADGQTQEVNVELDAGVFE